MTGKDVIRKLTSRKLWIAVVGFVTSMLFAFGYAETETTQIAAIIMGGAEVLGYLLAEGLADSANSAPAVGIPMEEIIIKESNTEEVK